MGIKRFIIKKHIISESKMFFTNFSAFISIFGVAIGVASLIVVLSITSGFQKAYKDKILAHSGEIFVRKYSNFDDYKEAVKKIETVKGVKGATPINYYQILISSKSGDRGAQVKAIDPKSIDKVSNFLETLKPTGTWKRFIGGKNQILIGSAIAESMNLKVNDTITITFPFTKDGRISTHPKILSFTIAGFVDTGMYDFDNHYTYISLKNAHTYFNSDEKVKGIEVKLFDANDADRVAKEIRDVLGHYEYPVTTFKEMYSNLFRSLEYQKFFIGLVLVIIMILASFSIIGTLLIFVTEKEKDIALLKAIGISRKELMKLFVMEGSVIGLIGIVLGFILSGALLFLINFVDLQINPDIYNISYIPISVKPMEVLIVASIAMVISILSTIYPSYRASKLNPSEGLSGRSISN